VDEEDGLNILAQGLKDIAQNKVAEDKRSYYLEHREGFGRDIYRVCSISDSDCWYGFLYEKNDSAYTLKTNYELELKGFEVIGRDNTNIRVRSG
jgi:hypothetical protein